MAWADVRQRIVDDLAGVAIASPVAATIKRAYEFPPRHLEDVPCFVIYPPSVEIERGPNNRRLKTYQSRIRLFVADEEVATAIEHLEAWREATIDMLDGEVALGNIGDVVNIVGPSVQEPGTTVYADTPYVTQDFLLTVRVRESRTFSL